ncbi:MAG TPA: PqiC family protein [Myxococcaceae bacterium]|nr:PqiC family protein [Myxococcaceae bacterium]
MRHTQRMSLSMVALAWAGCLGSSPVSRYYTLSTLSPHDAQGGGGGGPALRVRVAPVSLPEGVDRPQFVRRTGENTVVVDEFDRWVEPLDALLRNTLVQNLGALVPSAQVLGDAVPGLVAERTVVVAVNRLDLSGQLIMDTVWFVLPAGKDQPEHTRRTRLVESAGAGQAADIAQALGRAMERLSREIAPELVAPAPATPPPS